MSLFPVAIAIFYRWHSPDSLEVWVQRREDDGPYQGLMEFPGGGIEPGEFPLEAVVREVEEEVGIKIDPQKGVFMGTYSNERPSRTVLLNVFLFPDCPELKGKGQWLLIEKTRLSSAHKGLIPSPNHQIIDDLYQSLYDNRP